MHLEHLAFFRLWTAVAWLGLTSAVGLQLSQCSSTSTGVLKSYPQVSSHILPLLEQRRADRTPESFLFSPKIHI